MDNEKNTNTFLANTSFLTEIFEMFDEDDIVDLSFAFANLYASLAYCLLATNRRDYLAGELERIYTLQRKAEDDLAERNEEFDKLAKENRDVKIAFFVQVRGTSKDYLVGLNTDYLNDIYSLAIDEIEKKDSSIGTDPENIDDSKES